MKIKCLLTFFLIIICIGCQTDYRELDHRSMIVGMSFDAADNNTFDLSFQMPILGEAMQAMSPRQKDFEVVTISTEHLLESFSQFEARTPRVLFFGHLKVVVISSELKKENFTEIIDMLKRHPQIGSNVFLVISNESSASDLMKLKTPMISLSSLYLDTFFNSNPKISRTEDVKVYEYIRDSETVSKVALLPIVKKGADEVIIQDLALYKENEFVGSFIGKESGVALLLKNRRMDNIRTNVDMQDFQGNQFTAGVSNIKLKMRIRHKKTNPVEFSLQFTGTGILQVKNSVEAILTSELIKKIERKVEQDIENTIKDVIAKTQEINAEPYLFGQYLFGRSPRYFNSLDWLNTGWKEAKFDVNVDITIDNTGTIGMYHKKKYGK